MKIEGPTIYTLLNPHKFLTMLATSVRRVAAQPAVRSVAKRHVSFQTPNKIAETRQKFYSNPAVGKV